MDSGLYSFEEIIQDVRLETGITNLTNRYSEIRKLIKNAEREINPYTGFFIRKKMVMYSHNGNFDGVRFKKPDDFIVLDKIGSCKDGTLCDGCYYETFNHIIICNNTVVNTVVVNDPLSTTNPPSKINVKTITYTYWGIQCDDNGNPVTTQNHAEAVVAYIVWKMFSQKAFMGEGSHGVRRDYERIFNERCSESRGEDFFATESDLDTMARFNNQSMVEIYQNSNCKDMCISSECLYTIEEASDTKNTPPQISDNSTLLVQHYEFVYSDFIKNYLDYQNHPPGEFCVYGDVNNDVGVLSYDQVLLSNLQLPIKFNVSEITKLKFDLNPNIILNNNDIIAYNDIDNIQETIDLYLSDGYSMVKENNDLIFSKDIISDISNDTDIFSIFDATSMLIADAISIKNTLETWFNNYKTNNPDYNGNLYFIPLLEENWLSYGTKPRTGLFQSLATTSAWPSVTALPPDINTINWVPRTEAIVISFIDESFNSYHSADLIYLFGPTGDITEQPTHVFFNDFISFKNHYEDYSFFKMLIYPVVKSVSGEALILQLLASIEGSLLTQEEIDEANSSLDLSILLTQNPYANALIPNSTPPDFLDPLKNYNIKAIYDKTSPASNVFSSQIFADELDEFLLGSTQTVTETIRLIGSLIPLDEICFPFSVKEDSSDKLESIQHNYCFLKEFNIVNDIPVKIYSFTSAGRSIDFEILEEVDSILLEVDPVLLENIALEHTELSMIQGKSIFFNENYVNGFIIFNENHGDYRIINSLNIDITNTFNHYISYNSDPALRYEVYVLPVNENYTSTNIFYRFVKN